MMTKTLKTRNSVLGLKGLSKTFQAMRTSPANIAIEIKSHLMLCALLMVLNSKTNHPEDRKSRAAII